MKFCSPFNKKNAFRGQYSKHASYFLFVWMQILAE